MKLLIERGSSIDKEVFPLPSIVLYSIDTVSLS
jgi:hypothetical protein